MAGILVGAGGPGGAGGRRAGRVACSRSASPAGSATPPARWAVYARTDQLIAGLERAVDPNGDGDAHDAARVALVGVAEPFAAFADEPAVARGPRRAPPRHARRAPAGNDGPAGPGFGSISRARAGAPAALTVGAADLRADATARCASSLRAGLGSCSTAACRSPGGPSPRTTSTSASARRASARPRRRLQRRCPAPRLLRRAGLQPRRRPRGARPGRRRSGRDGRGARRGRARSPSSSTARSFPAGGLGARRERADPGRLAFPQRRCAAACSRRSARGAHRGRLDRRRAYAHNGGEGRSHAFSSTRPRLRRPRQARARRAGRRLDDGRAGRERRRLARATGRSTGRAPRPPLVAGAAALLAQARPGLARARRSGACSSARARSLPGRARHRRRAPGSSTSARRRRPRSPPTRSRSRSATRDGARLARARSELVVRNVSTRRLVLVRVRSDAAGRRPSSSSARPPLGQAGAGRQRAGDA